MCQCLDLVVAGFFGTFKGNMKGVFVAMLAAGIVALVASVDLNNLEDTDVEKLFADEEKRKAAFDCLMDQGPCNELQPLRDSLPSLVETKCAACTPKQKEKYDQVNKFLFEKYPEEYKKLAQKYSPKAE